MGQSEPAAARPGRFVYTHSMFERYTEKARRAIFFARYEAAQLGSQEIEATLLLLGTLREAGNLMLELAGGEPERVAQLTAAARNCQTQPPKRIATSVDLPLSHPSKRILAYAAEEAERLMHKHISPEHLVLGILRETGPANDILVAHGITLEATRQYSRTHPSPVSPVTNMAWPHDPARMALIVLAQDVPAARVTAAMRLLQGLCDESFEVTGKDSKGAFSFTFGP
jgi:ATP-dependent Clp protease ATP-binding subunit ClpC